MQSADQRIVSSERARESLISIVSQRTSTAMVLTNAAGQVVWANSRFEAMTGYSLAELAGRKPGDLLQGPLSDPAAIGRIRQAIASGAGCSLQLVNYAKSGHPYWTELELHPARNESGDVTNFLALQRDVTKDRLELKLQQLQIETQREIPDAGSALDALRQSARTIGRGMTWPQVALFTVEGGRCRDGEWLIAGEPPGPPLSLDSLSETVEHAFRDEMAAPNGDHQNGWASRRIVMPDMPGALFALACGRPAWGIAVLVARDADLGSDSGAMTFLLDHVGESISHSAERRSLLQSLERQKSRAELLALEAVQASRQLQEANDKLLAVARATALHTMIAGVVHEINQPLAALGGYLGVLRVRLASSDHRQAQPLSEALEKARQQVSRCAAIMQRLRDFGGSSTPEVAPVPIRSLIDEAVALSLVRERNAGLHLSIVHCDEPISVIVDTVQLQLVIINLLQNAAEASAGLPGQHIEIRAHVIDDLLVRISVSDRGTGVPPEMQGKLFQPFATSKSSGTGTGLAVCRMIVEASGGTIWHEPREGGGACFSFTLRYDRASG